MGHSRREREPDHAGRRRGDGEPREGDGEEGGALGHGAWVGAGGAGARGGGADQGAEARTAGAVPTTVARAMPLGKPCVFGGPGGRMGQVVGRSLAADGGATICQSRFVSPRLASASRRGEARVAHRGATSENQACNVLPPTEPAVSRNRSRSSPGSGSSFWPGLQPALETTS
ncbi:MAG: hypothetical protein EXR69_02950 [Myxococcales bacterium]|nr:hypothetical protein [Myxococcales bacterium]